MENGGNPTETARDASKNASGSGDGTSVVAVGRATFGHLRPPSASRNSRVPAVVALPALFHVKCRPITGTLHRFSRRLEWCVSYYTVGTSPIRNFARLDLKGQKKGEHVARLLFVFAWTRGQYTSSIIPTYFQLQLYTSMYYLSRRDAFKFASRFHDISRTRTVTVRYMGYRY